MPGFDITYSITPGIRSSLSVNTDFAEAEVDQRRVNLTRFPLQFPEQRDFFLEGSSIFSFAAGQRSQPLFFSRRIGLARRQPHPHHPGRAALLAGPATRESGCTRYATGETDERFSVGLQPSPVSLKTSGRRANSA